MIKSNISRLESTCEDEEATVFVQTAPAPPPLSLLQGTAQRNAVTKRMAARTDNRKLSREGQFNALRALIKVVKL